MDLDHAIAEVREFNKFERRPGETVAVYTYNKLTCLATLKCGSTFVTNTFHKNFNWRQIHFKEIDWNNSHVFSLMIDPIDRQAKAITEWLFQNRFPLSWYDGEKIKNFISQTPLLDVHSYSYIYLYYEEFANKIDWIPIDILDNHNQVKFVLEKLLNSHKIFVSQDKWATKEQSNISTSFKKSFEKQIKEYLLTDNGKLIMNYLKDDIDLYSRVRNNFNKDGQTWQDISWLNK